jgi:uncharacterized protein YbjT (DUF2867 family)
MILVTGASGNVGSAVLKSVLASGRPTAAMYLSESDARSAPSNVHKVIADFKDKQSLRRAFQSIDALFLVCAPIPELVELEGNAIEVAKELGVKHVVKNSSAGAGRWDKSFPQWHTEVERLLQASGVKYSIVRPNSFMQNITAFFAGTIQTQDAFYNSMGKSRVSLVDVRDIADVAAALLASENPENKIYELHGPDALTYDEVAQRISKVCGRTIRYIDIPMSEQKKALLSTGMPDWQAQALIDLQDYYVHGYGGECNDEIRRVAGHLPRTFDSFVEENAAAFSKRAATA